MKAPVITVLTATYNHPKFIIDCVKAFLAQAFDNWEQVIVDDGSTDNTGEIVEEFDDERIACVRQKHVRVRRLSETDNRSLKFARCEFAAVIEEDDFIPKCKLEPQLNGFSGGVVFGFSKCLYIDEAGHALGTWPLNGKRENICLQFCQDEQAIPSET